MQQGDLPPQLKRELDIIGVVATTPMRHAPVAWPKKPVEHVFRRPNLDENGEPDF